ncbi:helix-turn-helix transcriptional regulator [Polynucleobacter finlandensis]|uniref:helix-turn-helix transcriptional regulator n=1 Tax=Polynucleobacter finlandensis TaxID=1855894 RepID=UPI001C0AF6A8
MNDVNQVPQFTNLGEVARQTSLGKSTVLAWEAQGKFPRAIRLSPTKRVWLQSDIANWMLEKCKHS